MQKGQTQMNKEDTLTEGMKLLAAMKESQNNAEARENGNPELEKKVEEFSKDAPKAPEFITCPCCRKPTLVKPLELSGPVLDHYMACLVSGTPFSHTYPIYKGKLEITATRLSKEQEQKVLMASNVITQCEARLPEISSVIRELNNMIKLYCCIKEIKLNAGDLKAFYPQDAVFVVCDGLTGIRMDILSNTISNEDLTEKLNNWYKTLVSPSVLSAVPSTMIAGVVETHSQLYYILLESGFDVNFWTGIELA